MHKHNWSRFVLRIPVNASKEFLYRLWATRNGLESWFLRKAEFVKPNGEVAANDELLQEGDTYEWLWHGWPDDTVERGTVLRADGKEHFGFSFGQAGNVTVKLKDEADEIMVELVQDDIPTDEEGRVKYHIGCSQGWLFYLANLKSIAEGGIDLRNRKVELKEVVNS